MYRIKYTNFNEFSQNIDNLKSMEGGNVYRTPESSNDYKCPITQEIMLDPVIAADGNTYERNAIERWFRTRNTSPKTNLRLTDKTLRPVIALRNIIEDYIGRSIDEENKAIKLVNNLSEIKDELSQDALDGKDERTVTMERRRIKYLLAKINIELLDSLKDNFSFKQALDIIDEQIKEADIMKAGFFTYEEVSEYMRSKYDMFTREFWKIDRKRIIRRINSEHNINTVDKFNRTVLHYAAMDKAGPEVVALLLEKGADVNAVDMYKSTAFIYAVSNKAGPEVVSLLLEKGADVNAMDNIKETALHLAVVYKAGPEVVALLLEKSVNVNAVNISGMTSLHLAAMVKADPEVVDMLLEKGAEVNAVNNDKSTALHLAAMYKAGPEVVALLLDKGVNVNTLDATGRTALHLAVLNKARLETIRLILDKGGDLQKFPLEEFYQLAARENVDKEVLDLLRRLE